MSTCKNWLAEFLHSDWQSLLRAEFEKPYMLDLAAFLRDQYQQPPAIYPPAKAIFHALNLTPPSAVKAVILGQDPYHGAGQAHGLAFSVIQGCSLPPSLRNIFKELQDDLGVQCGLSGCLEQWARQGVMLLNTVLTVEGGKAGSHQGRGWEWFTDRVIKMINERSEPSVFMLWGSHAQRKAEQINQQRHAVLQAPHPSPLSAYRGFLGCRHFSLCNDKLRAWGRQEIDWSLD